MTQAHPDSANAWDYNLLGDPSMRIRHEFPTDVKVLAPATIGKGVHKLSLVVKDASDVAIPGALVAISNGIGATGKHGIFTNAYADESGFVSFDVNVQSLLDIEYTAQDDRANLARGVIRVVDANGCSAGKNEHYGQGKEGSTGSPTLSGMTLPRIGQTDTIRIDGGLPGAIPYLLIGTTPAAVPFDKGTLLMLPFELVAIPAPIQADGSLTLSGAIAADPGLCGAEICFQALWVDPAAPGFHHLVLTNGLKQTVGA
jgi:hypothetical protein